MVHSTPPRRNRPVTPLPSPDPPRRPSPVRRGKEPAKPVQRLAAPSPSRSKAAAAPRPSKSPVRPRPKAQVASKTPNLDARTAEIRALRMHGDFKLRLEAVNEAMTSPHVANKDRLPLLETMFKDEFDEFDQMISVCNDTEKGVEAVLLVAQRAILAGNFGRNKEVHAAVVSLLVAQGNCRGGNMNEEYAGTTPLRYYLDAERGALPDLPAIVLRELAEQRRGDDDDARSEELNPDGTMTPSQQLIHDCVHEPNEDGASIIEHVRAHALKLIVAAVVVSGAAMAYGLRA